MRRMLFALCLLQTLSCSRSPDPRLYTLVAQPSRESFPLSANIEVRRPTVAGYLDRRDIVRSVLAEKLELAGDANWAEPLDAMFGRVLAADLSIRLPNSRVFTDLNTLGAVADTRIDLELQRFEHGQDGLVLRALVAMRSGDSPAPVSLEAVELKDTSSGSSTGATVASMNELLGQLADRIARQLASAPVSLPPTR